MLKENIKSIRKSKGLSQEELAIKLNVVRQTISKWELGETSPDIKQAKELSKIFKISLDELVDNNLDIACKNNLTDNVFSNLIGKTCHLNVSETLYDFYLNHDKPVKILEVNNDFIKIEYNYQKEKHTKLIDIDLIISIKVVEGE